MLRFDTVKRGVLLIPLLLFGWVWIQAQTVTGKIVDRSSGDPLVGVTVMEEGTKNATVSDVDGMFAIRLTSGATARLTFSYVGYNTVTLNYAGSNLMNVSMEAGAALSEVVVTALGIRRESKKLGYSVTQVEGESLTQAREINIANALVGKVAGLNVSSLVSGPGGSSRITLRGNTSISGDNQPLFVVNGIPMDNSNLGSAGLWGGADFGDGISSINPDDIESMTVLKGASASALYGFRAKNGVILITTKSGKAQQGVSVEWNSNYTMESPVILTDWQTTYGQGTLNAKPVDAAAGRVTGLYSWGDQLDGSQSFEFDGVQRPYSAKDNAAEGFYQNGNTFTNTVALSGGNEKGNYRVSFANLANTSIVPNAGLNRNTLTFGTGFGGKRLHVDFKGSYIKEKGNNRPGLSDSPGNANFAINFLPANVDQALLAGEDGEGSDRTGVELKFNDNDFITNPYFAAYKFIRDSDKDRLMYSGSVRYDLADWIYLQGRYGQDFFINRTTNVTPTGTAYNGGGNMEEVSFKLSEVNVDGLLGIEHDFNDIFGINAGVGASRMDRRSERLSAGGGQFVVPYLYSIGNLNSRGYGYAFSRNRVNSVYGFAELSMWNQVYLNLTGRNDWYSTLTNPSYFYPSASLAWVFSEALNSDFFNYGKVRVAYANVGGDTNPYQTALYYNIAGSINSTPLGNISNGSIPNSNLKPLSVKELEAGIDIRILDNRIGLDLAWYNKVTTNDIVAASISGTSGYGSAVFNLGELTNSGIEALLSVTPVRSDNFTWMTSVNLATNTSEVVSLAGELSTLQVDGSRTLDAYVHQTVGLPFANIKAFDYKRDDNGNILLANGLPQQGDLIDMGSGVHKLTGGWNNEFNIGRINLGFLIDFKTGGKIYSATNAFAYTFGVHQNTLEGREGGIVADGIDEATGEANTISVSAQDYYGRLADIGSLFVYDASFIKFRQFTLGYTLPSLFNGKVKSVNLSLVGRNLFTLWDKVDNIDPETNYSNSNAQGLELAGLPIVRTLGLNLNVKF